MSLKNRLRVLSNFSVIPSHPVTLTGNQVKTEERVRVRVQPKRQ